MSDVEIMSGTNQLPYDEINVMDTLKKEFIKELGKDTWDELAANVEIPADNMEQII